jgi:hypothetical protein
VAVAAKSKDFRVDTQRQSQDGRRKAEVMTGKFDKGDADGL